jgi:hypothetical protein
MAAICIREESPLATLPWEQKNKGNLWNQTQKGIIKDIPPIVQ